MRLATIILILRATDKDGIWGEFTFSSDDITLADACVIEESLKKKLRDSAWPFVAVAQKFAPLSYIFAIEDTTRTYVSVLREFNEAKLLRGKPDFFGEVSTVMEGTRFILTAKDVQLDAFLDMIKKDTDGQ